MEDRPDFRSYFKQNSQQPAEGDVEQESQVNPETADVAAGSNYTPEQLAQVENLLRESQIAKMRGQDTIYEKLLKEAEEIAPNATIVLEAIGESYFERKQYRRAKEYYHKAHLADPDNARIETKYAELVLKVDLAIDPFVKDEFESMASARSAAILSFFIPGLGQAVTGKFGLGIGIFVTWAIGWVILLTASAQEEEGLKTVLSHPGEANPIIYLGGFLILASWLWGFTEASAAAKRYTPKQIERPVPPSDHDFEIK